MGAPPPRALDSILKTNYLSMNHAVIRIGFQVTYGSVVTILLAAAQGNFFVRVLFAPFAFQPVRVIRGSAAFELN